MPTICSGLARRAETMLQWEIFDRRLYAQRFFFGSQCFKTWTMSWLVGAFAFLPIYSALHGSPIQNRKLLESFVQVYCSPGSPSPWFGGAWFRYWACMEKSPAASHGKFLVVAEGFTAKVFPWSWVTLPKEQDLLPQLKSTELHEHACSALLTAEV